MEKLIEVKNLKTYFYLHQGELKAVEGVTFDIVKGGILGIVGESGCGKSVTARSIMRIEGKKAKIVEGEILFHGHNGNGGIIDIAKLDPKGDEIRKIRGAEISMIFQEPMTSLSPVYTVGNQIIEAVLLHQEGVDKAGAREIAIDMLGRVGIPNPGSRVDEYPHQLSGGMRQRAMIAIALCCHPRLLIADEPTTALDVTIQAQILDLLRDLQKEFGMAIMIITHDLGVIAELSESVAVMYLGKIVEAASTEELFAHPLHPYTEALMQSIPMVDEDNIEKLESITGMVPDPFNIPAGCAFYPRCKKFISGRCDASIPELVEVSPGHKVSCFLYSGEKESGK